MKNQKKQKMLTFLVAIILTTILILLYFLDTSLEWNNTKIISCIIISIWIFFAPPTILYFLYKIKNSNIEYSIRLGVSIGINGLYMLLIAPYFGLKAYIINLDEVKNISHFLYF